MTALLESYALQAEREVWDTVAAIAAAERAEPVCVDCGQKVAPVLASLGSIRCHDCRDGRHGQ